MVSSFPHIVTTTQLEITQHLALPEQLAQAAAVYYEAFAHKLDGLEFASHSPEQTLRILIECIQPEMAVYALSDSRVVGVAGMQYRGRRFYVVPWAVWRREFGLFGGLRRWVWFRLGQFFVHPAADALRVDGIAVAAAARAWASRAAIRRVPKGCAPWSWKSWTPTPTRGVSMSGWGSSS